MHCNLKWFHDLFDKKILTITTEKEILASMIILTSDTVRGRQNLEFALSRCEQNI